MVRGVGDINRHPSVLFHALSDPSKKPVWNKQFKCLEEIEVLDDCNKVCLSQLLYRIFTVCSTYLVSVPYYYIIFCFFWGAVICV